MDDIISNADIRREKARHRLGAQKDGCCQCAESDPICIEDHHIAGQAYHDQTTPLCRNCHRKVTALQLDHPAPVSSPPTFLEVVGHYLIGLADVLRGIADTIVGFGRTMIEMARQSVSEGAQ